MPTLKLIPNRCKLTVVQLRIRGVPHNFIVDTGATSTTVVPELLPAMKPYTRIRGATHYAANGEPCHSHDAEFTFKFAGVQLSYVNVSQTGYHMTEPLGIPISGLIGQDLLRKFKRVVVDYTRETITFEV